MKIMQLSDKTKTTMTIGQMIALVAFIFAVGGGYTELSQDVAAADKKAQQAVDQCDESKSRIERIEKDREVQNLEIMKMIQEIRESQIRIEGKLDLKQDRFK